jgi:hypothetical protein
LIEDLMKIIIAGEDRAADIGAEIRQKAAELKKRQGRAAPPQVSPEIGAPVLYKATSDSDYFEHFVRLLRYRDAFDTHDFDIPRRRGPLGAGMAKIKKALWKLLRYQHDRIAFRQNLINSLFTHAIEFESVERRRGDAELRGRLDKHEALLAKLIAEQKNK